MSPLPWRVVRSAAIPLALFLAFAPAASAVVAAKPTTPQNLKAAVATHTTTTAKLHISWTAPANDGDGAGPYKIGAYNVSVNPAFTGSTCATGATTLACDIDGFALGTSYKIMVTATNTYDVTSDPAYIIYKVPVLPGAPTAFTATILTNDGSRASVKLAWNAPASDGGGTITGYSINGGSGISCATPGTSRSCQITGLWSNRTFTFTIVATNVIGSGPVAKVSISIPASPVGGDATPEESAAPTAEPTATPTASPTIAPTPTPTPEPTIAPTPTPEPTASTAPEAPAGSTGDSGSGPMIFLVVAAAAAVLIGAGTMAWKMRS